MASMAAVTPPPAPLEADPWELAGVFLALRRHAWLSLAIIAGCVALAALSLLLPRSYSAAATLTYDPQTPLIKGGGDLPMTDPQRDAGIDAQLDLVASLPVARDVARDVDRAANPRLQQEAEATAAHSDRALGNQEALGTALLDHVKARRAGQTAQFTIGFTAGSADQAARIANGFAASYLAAALWQKSALARATTRQLDGQLAALREQANLAESDLARFRLGNDLLDQADSTAMDQEVATLHDRLAEARGQAALAGSRSAAAAATTVVGGGASGSVDTAAVSALTQQRAATAADLAALLGRHGERHPDVIAARRKLAELEAQLALALQGNGHSAAAEADGAGARAAALAGSLAEARARLAAALGHDARLLDLQNSAQAARQAYQDVLKVSADQIAQRVLLQPDVQLAAGATPPLRPDFPRAGINLPAGLLLGLAVALVAGFVRASWRHTLGSVDDIGRWLETDHFAPVPLLAAAQSEPPPAFVASVRSLADAALSAAGNSPGSGTGNHGRVIGIASAVAGEGKTTVSIAMGRMLAATGLKVALVGIAGGAVAPAPVQRIDPTGLVLISAGGAAATLIAALRHDYDAVIVDIPAILPAAASGSVLECLDATVLLARWRSTSIRAIREAMGRIAAAGGHVAGVALSMVPAPGR